MAAPPIMGSWCGESPMADRFFLGLFGYCLQLIDHDLGVELAGYLLAESVDRLRDFLVLWLQEKLTQGPGPVEPFGVDLNLLAVVNRDDVIHGPDVATGIDPDSLA